MALEEHRKREDVSNWLHAGLVHPLEPSNTYNYYMFLKGKRKEFKKNEWETLEHF